MNFIPSPQLLYPHTASVRSVFVLSRLVVLCKRGGEGERVREGLTRDTRAIVVGVRV